MNWEKVISNAGLVFATTLGATSFTGNVDAFLIAIINAFIVGLIAFFTELNIECDNKNNPIAAFQTRVNNLLLI